MYVRGLDDYSVSRSAYTYRERVHNPVRTSVTIPWIHCTVNCDRIMLRRGCPGEIDTRGDRCRNSESKENLCEARCIHNEGKQHELRPPWKMSWTVTFKVHQSQNYEPIFNKSELLLGIWHLRNPRLFAHKKILMHHDRFWLGGGRKSVGVVGFVTLLRSSLLDSGNFTVCSETPRAPREPDCWRSSRNCQNCSNDTRFQLMRSSSAEEGIGITTP